MTHSVKNRRKRERLHHSLIKRVKALAKLACKQHKDPHIVSGMMMESILQDTLISLDYFESILQDSLGC